MSTNTGEDFGPEHRVYKRMPWYKPVDNPDSVRFHVARLTDSTPTMKLPSGLVRLLEHNNPLSAQEAREVRTLQQTTTSSLSINEKESIAILESIQNIQKQIEDLRNQSKELERHSQELKIKKSLLHEQNLVCTTMLSPFRTLPHHILQRIIMQRINDPHQHGLARYVLIRRLAHVCKSFRAILTRTPKLRNDIVIFWDSFMSTPGEPSNPVSLIQWSSSLCSQLPLSVELNEDGAYFLERLQEDNDVQGLPSTLKLLLTQWNGFPRLRHFGISSARMDFVLPIFIQCLEKKSSIPTITSLTLRQRDMKLSSADQVSTIPRLDSTFRRLPGLRHLQLSFNIEDKRFPLHLLPTNDHSPGWNNLRALNLSGRINRSTWIQILKNCPNLKAASFDADNNESVSDSTPKKIDQRHINELVVEFDLFDTFMSFFANQQYPSITTLDVQFLEDTIAASDKLAKKRTSAVKKTTFPALKHLVLVNTADIADKPKRLYPLFSSLSSITHLTITLHRKDIADFVRFLRGTPAKGCNLVNLQQLDLRFVPSEEWDNSEQSLRDFTKLLLSIQRDRQEVLSKNSQPEAPSDFKLVVWFICIEYRYLFCRTYPQTHQGTMRKYFCSLRDEFLRTDFEHLDVRLLEEMAREDSDCYQGNKLGHYFDVNSGFMA